MKTTKLVLFLFLSTIAFGAQRAAANPISKGPDNGVLLLVGGGIESSFFRRTFIDLAGGANAHVIVIPSAQGADQTRRRDPDYVATKQPFKALGAASVSVLNTENPSDGNSDKYVNTIKKATGIWFTGGRQWRIADGFLNTRSHVEFKNLLARGGVIAGTSAGATIQGSFLARGHSGGNTVMIGDHQIGLGFLEHTAVDQHVFARNRQFDMFEILDKRPGLLGIGLGEDTGIIVRKGNFEVIGSRYVAIYDGTRWSAEKNTIFQLPPKSREFYVLRRGQRYDLINRKVIVDD